MLVVRLPSNFESIFWIRKSQYPSQKCSPAFSILRFSILGLNRLRRNAIRNWGGRRGRNENDVDTEVVISPTWFYIACEILR